MEIRPESSIYIEWIRFVLKKSCQYCNIYFLDLINTRFVLPILLRIRNADAEHRGISVFIFAALRKTGKGPDGPQARSGAALPGVERPCGSNDPNPASEGNGEAY